MKRFFSGSIRWKLVFLVVMAILPVLLIMLYTGMEQRRSAINNAKQDVQFLTYSMAQVQEDISRSCRQILSTLVLLPQIQALDVEGSREILAAVLKSNPEYHNMALTDASGQVLTSAKGFSRANLSDRKHIREALASKGFAAGEFITTRLGPEVMVFPYAYPILGDSGEAKGVLTTAVDLKYFIGFYEHSVLPEKSFVAVTDHQGVRLLYYPPTASNPIGEPIKPASWKIASSSDGPGIFIRSGSDGTRRIFAYAPVSFSPGAPPYMYVWAGVPEAGSLKSARDILFRNLLLLLLATLLALVIARWVGRKTLLAPIAQLIDLTHKYSAGELSARSQQTDNPDEFGRLTRAFHDMAEKLSSSHQAMRENQALLAEEKERLAVTLRSIGEGVITSDTAGQVMLINRVAESLTGWSSHEAIGQPLNQVFKIINDEAGEPIENPVAKVLSSGGIISREAYATLIDKKERKRAISSSAAPIHDGAGEVIGVVLVFRDVTEQQRTEQELVKIKKLESIGVLAGGIAHDFNNILAAILGNIDLSLRDNDISERTERLLKQAQSASFRARDLTQQLLTFAKGGQPIKKTASLAEVVKESAEFVLRGGKVACDFHFAEDLWLVDIDKGQISQVVQNLIINASNAMPTGGKVEIIAKNAEANDPVYSIGSAERYVKLMIKDTGVGIPADLLDKIFDPYFTTKQQGSGLGLAITHSIINKHGGTISVESTPGQGTCFSICLPASLQRVLQEEEKEDAVPDGRKARILVMDDEEIVREIVSEMLLEMGHEVLLAEDGLEALQCYQEAKKQNQPIDLGIMDLTIPGGVGGKDALEQILNIDRSAKVIVSSGYSNDPVMANYQNYGFCAAISKPYKFAELIRLVNRFVG